MFLTFPVLGNSALSTIETRIWINNPEYIPDCKDCGQKMNELYISEKCSYIDDNQNSLAIVHVHFSHRHYELNKDYRTHFCVWSCEYYEFPKSH